MTEVCASPDSGLSEFVAFVGELALEGDRVPVNFKARIDDAGEVQYEFEKMMLNASTRFIFNSHGKNTSKFALFNLIGRADDGTRIQSDNLIFTAMSPSFRAEGDWIQPVGSSSIATFFRTLSPRSILPTLNMRLRGFQGFHPLHVECELGSIAMAGPNIIENPNLLSGTLQLKATTVPDDLLAWKAKADKLLDHVRRVMSFASAVILRIVLSDCIGRWSSDREELTKELVADFNERLNDLNRRSILDKLNALIQLWNVPLEGISESQLKAAKKARDLIVHRGHYYDNDEKTSGVLWDHFTVIKELVVRILFMAIGYRGQYISYVGGMHHAHFPPEIVSAEV